MDPVNDCPICFETYEEEPDQQNLEPVGRHWPVKLDCCQQLLCCHCQQCLARCPFCRVAWHPEEEDDQNFWQRRSFPNPILTVWGTTLAFDAIRVMASSGLAGVRAVATAAAAAAAETSPAVLAASTAGAVALAGGLALLKASEHRPDMAQRLQGMVASRPRRQLAVLGEEMPQSSVSKAVASIWEALEWHLSPQWPGMPHVYTGSLWRSEARQKYHQRLEDLLSGQQAAGSEEPISRRFWADLVFLFLLWLDYNPHTPNWGSSPTYGLGPLHLCWHNRWREDLRHVVSDFARYLYSDHIQEQLPAKEAAQAACLVAMLDHVLSWEVTTLDRGSSDLIQASRWNYPDFCQKLQERFAEAWAAAMAPPEVELSCRSFQTHAEAMALREVPEHFQLLWSM